MDWWLSKLDGKRERSEKGKSLVIFWRQEITVSLTYFIMCVLDLFYYVGMYFNFNFMEGGQSEVKEQLGLGHTNYLCSIGS